MILKLVKKLEYMSFDFLVIAEANPDDMELEKLLGMCVDLMSAGHKYCTPLESLKKPLPKGKIIKAIKEAIQEGNAK